MDFLQTVQRWACVLVRDVTMWYHRNYGHYPINTWVVCWICWTKSVTWCRMAVHCTEYTEQTHKHHHRPSVLAVHLMKLWSLLVKKHRAQVSFTSNSKTRSSEVPRIYMILCMLPCELTKLTLGYLGISRKYGQPACRLPAHNAWGMEVIGRN